MQLTEALTKELAAFAKSILDSDKPLSSNGIGTGAMVAGYIGKVTGYEFGPVVGARTVKRNNDQTYKIGDKIVTVAEKGDDAIAFYMVFNDGAKRITTTLLEQNPNSTIKLPDGEKKFSTFIGTDWKALIGKTIKCTHAARDEEAAPISRLNGVVTEGVAQLSAQKPMLFHFELVADVPPAK